jgi:hypothetical protein
MALGLLLVATSYTLARSHAAGALPCFWIGLLEIVLPTAWRLAGRRAYRGERLALVVLLGLTLYGVKVLYNPLGFAQHDEFLHWHTADAILRTGRLFGPNSLLPVSSLYPGLESVTSALVSLSGMSIFLAGTIVVGVARALLMLALFLFVERITRSPRVAGLTSLFYCTNFSFLIFDAQYSYESLALPLAVLTLFFVSRARDGTRTRGSDLRILLLAAAVVVTHHLTSYALVAFLGAWWAIERWRGGAALSRRVAVIGETALATAALALLWLVAVAHITIGYLAPTFFGAVGEVVQIAARETGGRVPFQSYAGEPFPLWERVLSLAAVGLVTLAIPVGLLALRRTRASTGAVIALALAALLFPVSQVLRLTRSGAELASRSPEFLFLGIALLEAAICLHPRAQRLARPLFAAVFLPILGVLLLGGVFTGVGPSSRLLPGTYRIEADAESIEPQGLDTASWAKTALGPDNRIAADRVNGLLLGSYGEQYPVTNLADHVNIAAIYFSDALNNYDRLLLQQGKVRYVVVDRRMTEGLPLYGVYVENGEPDSYLHRTPVSSYALAKFATLPGVSKVYDSGEIVIYDVRAISGAQ